MDKREEKPNWPKSLVLRDTKVYADEGQRIFTTATGYGYERQEYVRADVVESLLSQARSQAYEEIAAYVEGKGSNIPGASIFAPLVSRNRMPDMSGDPRARLSPTSRREFDDATRDLAQAIRQHSQKGGENDR